MTPRQPTAWVGLRIGISPLSTFRRCQTVLNGNIWAEIKIDISVDFSLSLPKNNSQTLK